MDSKIPSSLGFSDIRDVWGRYSVADLFPSKRTGIYLLHFPDNTYYVGQAVDVVRRFAQHKKRFNEIAGIAFRKVAKSQLNAVEQECIFALEKECTLRNIALVSSPIQESDLDDLISKEDQETWLNTDFQQATCKIFAKDELLRSKYHAKFATMKVDLQAQQYFFPVMKEYLKYCIPEPYKTEISFWGCSCYPRYYKSDVKLFGRVNIRWQEVFTVHYDKETQTYGYSFHTTKLDLPEKIIKKLEKRFSTLEITDHIYPSGGADQCNPFCSSLEDAFGLLHDATFVHAIKNFNLRNMRKGPEMYSRYHCVDLAEFALSE